MNNEYLPAEWKTLDLGGMEERMFLSLLKLKSLMSWQLIQDT